jgi:hypothetical protein
MKVAFGVLLLTHTQFFDLTPFQFVQLYRGWEERERQSAIKHAQTLITIANVHRGEKDKEIKLSDVLPWYDEYIGMTAKEEIKERFIDTRIPQVDRLRARILEDKHLNPETIDHNDREYIEATRIATMICDQQKSALKDVIQVDGVMIKKADPKEWGDKFPDW